MRILYVDMDNVLVDFQSGIDRLGASTQKEFEGRMDEVPGIFALMDPVAGAISAYEALSREFETYILSTAPWMNISAWSDKIEWVHEYMGEIAHKRLILTHRKDLNKGDYLIDDRTKNGAAEFEGEHIHFLSDRFPDWDSVLNYLLGGTSESEAKRSR